MKNICFYILAALLLVGLASCSDDNEPARTPVASATISQANLEVNQSMQINFTGVADQVVVYTGDAGHVYALRDSSDTGFPVNKGIFTYSYSSPGTFHVVVVASTYDTYMGGNLRQDTVAFDVMVKDDVTALDRVYSSITPNVYYADAVDDATWVLRLPSKQVYNNREVTLKAERQRLSFDIASGASKIYVDGEAWTRTAWYDLTKTHDISVVSDFGSTRHYKLHTLIYPEFSSISVNGVVGKLVRDAYDQSAQTYRFALPAGTDLAHLSVTFATSHGGTFFVGDREVASGSEVDLSAGAACTIVSVASDNSLVKATARVAFEFQ